MRSALVFDVRLSLRALLRSPLTTVPALLTLALAIGANTAVFSVVNALLLRELPVHDPERLMSVSSDFATSRGFRAGAGWSYTMWESLRQRSALFGGTLAWSAERFTLGRSGETQPVSGYFVSGEFFSTLGVRALHGRLFTEADDRKGALPVAVISHRLWMRRFAGAPTAVNSTLVVDGAPVTIIGVTAPSFSGLEVGQPFQLALPINAEPAIRGPHAGLLKPRSFLLLVLLRLKDGQTIEGATNSLRSVQSQIVPAAAPAFVREPFTLVPASGGTGGPTSAQQVYRRPLLMMLAWVALVLVIACINIANLLGVRGTMRHRELALRAALGASRWRLARPLLIESVLLAVGGSVLGLTLAPWCARVILMLSPVVLDPVVDARVTAFTAAVAAVAVMLFGVAPACRAARVAPVTALTNGRTGNAAGQRRASGALVAMQIALTLVVMTTAGLLVRTLAQLGNVPLGFDAERVLVANVSAARSRVDDGQRINLYDRLIERIEALPGVEGAAVSRWTPLTGAGGAISMRAPNAPSGSEINILANFIGPGWLRVYGTPLLAGRDFTSQDSSGSPRVVIVNETFARRFLPTDTAVGSATPDGQIIVGIARNAVYRTSQRIPGITSLALREPVPPTVYAPLAQQSLRDGLPNDAFRISIRSAGATPASMAPSVASAITAVDPDLTFEFRPLAEDVRSALAQERFSAVLSVCFGLLSLVLSIVGLYGVTSYAVNRQVREMGVRMALGARPEDVLRRVLAGATATLAIGIVIGLGLGMFVARLISSMLFGIRPLDPLTLAGVSLLLAAVGTIAALVPAWRASRIDPAAALRTE